MSMTTATMRAALVAVPLAAAVAPASAQTVYRAGGTEPYWRLTIDAGTMRLDEAGKPPVVVPRPTAETNAGGERYAARGLVLDTIRAQCILGASTRIYRDMVIVEVGGRTLRGCGTGATGGQMNALARPVPNQARPAPPKVASAQPRPAPPAARQPATRPAPGVAAPPAPTPGAPLILGKTRPALANTRWTVWKVRDREVSTPRPLTVNFTANQVEGQRCNRFRGGYTLAGERLQAPSIAATRMACQGPAAAAETAIFTMLRQATRAQVSKWGTLILGNGSDTVMLRPAR